MEVWFADKETIEKALSELKAKGFNAKKNGLRIKIPISAFSVKAELLLDLKNLSGRITETSEEYDHGEWSDYPREVGVYQYQDAKITIKNCYNDETPYQLFEGISKNLDDLIKLYQGIKAGEIFPKTKWQTKQTGISQKNAVEEAESIIRKNRNNTNNQEEP